jgi:hypothetical protein
MKEGDSYSHHGYVGAVGISAAPAPDRTPLPLSPAGEVGGSANGELQLHELRSSSGTSCGLSFVPAEWQ